MVNHTLENYLTASGARIIGLLRPLLSNFSTLRTVSYLAVACVLPLQPVARAQDTFRSEVNLVNILATVTDAKGRPVTDLKKDDFSLLADGKPQAIYDFVAQTNLPLSLGLLVDTSASMAFAIDSERMASREFLRTVLRPEGDRAFVMRFDKDVVMLSRLEGSQRELGRAMEQISLSREPVQVQNRSTALFDAVVEACDRLKAVPGRKAIIVLTDGLDAGSFSSENDAVEAALRTEISVYTILVWHNILDEEATRHESSALRQRLSAVLGPIHESGRRTLQTLSEQTGGRSFEASERDQFNRVYGQIASELRSQYRIGLMGGGQTLSPAVSFAFPYY